MGFLDVFGFGPASWGGSLVKAAGMTVLVAGLGFLLGGVIGAAVAWARVGGRLSARWTARLYTTVLRGIPDLLVIYLLYFGGSFALGSIGTLFGHAGFVELPPLSTGVVALGIVSGAYHAEVYRGAYLAIPPGQFEAAASLGMKTWQVALLITFPLVLRYALAGLGNVWQMVLKESALISVIGLVELMRQAQIGAGSTSQPFLFYAAAGALYLAISSISSAVFHAAEKRSLLEARGR